MAIVCSLPWIPWQWHLLNGIQVPLSLVALDGIRRGAFIGRRPYGRLARAWRRAGPLSKAPSPACVGLALLCCLAALTDPYLVRKYTIAARDHARDLFLSRGEEQAMSWLERNAAREDVVLASPEVSHFIPRFSGNKVVAGEDLLTKNYARKKEGTERFYGQWGDADRLAFLSTWRVRYVMHGPAERRLGSWSPAALGRLEEVFRSGEASIYLVRETML